MTNLFKNVSVREIGAPIANASDTDSNSDRIDMANWDGALFICPIEDSANTGVATLTIEQNTIDSDSGMTALSGAVATYTDAGGDALNNKLLVVDVYRPRERYIQAVRTSTIANIAFGTLTVVLYNHIGKLPITAHSTVLHSAVVASPAEG